MCATPWQDAGTAALQPASCLSSSLGLVHRMQDVLVERPPDHQPVSKAEPAVNLLTYNCELPALFPPPCMGCGSGLALYQQTSSSQAQLHTHRLNPFHRSLRRCWTDCMHHLRAGGASFQGGCSRAAPGRSAAQQLCKADPRHRGPAHQQALQGKQSPCLDAWVHCCGLSERMSCHAVTLCRQQCSS